MVVNNGRIINGRGYLIGDTEPTDIYSFNPESRKWESLTERINIKLKVKKLIKLQRFIKLYIRLPILWRIAEYYTKKKYAPENILKYINLE